MEWLLILWPIIGWVSGYCSTPKWMFQADPNGYLVLFFCGGVAGPFGLLWFLPDDND